MQTSNPSKDSALRRFLELPFSLLEPAASVTDAAERRRGRLLSGILLIAAVPVAAATGWGWLDARFVPLLYVGLFLFATAFLLSRYGHSQAAALILLAWLWAMPVIRMLMQIRLLPPPINPFLPDAVLSIIVTYLLFSPRVVGLTFLIHTATLLLSPVIDPTLNEQQTLFALFFLFSISALMMAAAVLRQYDQAQLAQQSRALKASEERYRMLFESTFEAIIVHDEGILIDANPAFESLSGYTLWEMIGHPLTNVIAPDDQEGFHEHVNQGTLAPYEFRVIRKDGTLLEVEALNRPHTYEGRAVWVMAVRDITERKQAQAEHMELSIEREKRKLLMRLMSNVSHDLRTPLSVIRTGLYLLRRLIDDPEQRQQQLEVLEHETDEFQRLMDELLNMSHLDRSDTDEFRFELADLNDLLYKVIEEHRAFSQRKHQTLVFRPRNDLPPVLVDVYQFSRLFKHLLLNAITYTPEEGTITVESGVDGQHLWVRVNDTGIGIEPEDLPFIFDHFYRAVSARRNDRSGIGLGLTIARKIAEGHGGSIDVKSTPGRGSMFTVHLPSAQVNAVRKHRLR